MSYLFRPHLAKQDTALIKRWVMLGLVLLSLLTTQWLGLVHQIGHHEFKLPAKPYTHDSVTRCDHHDHSIIAFLGHEKSSVECQLFDAITLTGLITSGLVQFVIPNSFSQSLFGIVTQVSASRTQQHYQSRAPPTPTL